MSKSSAEDARNLALSQAIHTILDRRGIEQRRHRAALETALGMQYQQVRRRMTGEKTWSVGELARLAAHFGESAFKLIAILIDEEGQPATYQVHGASLACTIWPGEQLPKEKIRGPLVAVASEPHGSWLVMGAAEAGSRPAHEIKRLIVEETARWRVGVVDADAAWTERLIAFLRRKGLDAIGFCTFDQARAAIETSQYDGLIIDWALAPDDAEAMLRAARARTQGPILLVSDPSGEETLQQDDRLAFVAAEHGAQLYEKPTRPVSLYSALELGFKVVEARSTR